jgi:hypothetical protein
MGRRQLKGLWARLKKLRALSPHARLRIQEGSAPRSKTPAAQAGIEVEVPKHGVRWI